MRDFCASTETSVGAVLASDVDSTELSVDAMLCLEVDRRRLFGVLASLGFRLIALTEVCGPDPAQNLPRNREAAACI